MDHTIRFLKLFMTSDISTTSDVYVHQVGSVVVEGAQILAEEILANRDLFVTQRSEMVS